MFSPNISLVRRPDSETEICQIADRVLRRAGAVGRLPTPIDELIAAVGVENVLDPEAVKERFIARLGEHTRTWLVTLWQKLRGIADLRDRVIYVPNETTPPRVLFAKGHELGHQVIPWQRVNTAYRDDDFSLSPEAQDLFDVEANYFASEIIFQGQRFTNRLRDYKPSFDTVFVLAEEHGASNHATLRRYVEEHDEALAAIPYWPSVYAADEKGFPVLRVGKVVGSSRFVQKYAGIRIPPEIRSGHPWVGARELSRVCEGEVRLDCGANPIGFQWQSWWNTYSLLVLLRRKPALSIVGQLIR